MKKTFIYILVVLSTLTSCSNIISNHPNLGNGYKFIHEGKYGLQIVNFKNTVVIKSCVIKYGIDSTFVLVSQRPLDRILDREAMTYSESNKAFEKSTFKQYWIINKGQSSVFSQMTKRFSNIYGPYSKEKYLEKREELGVPEELKLEFEY